MRWAQFLNVFRPYVANLVPAYSISDKDEAIIKAILCNSLGFMNINIFSGDVDFGNDPVVDINRFSQIHSCFGPLCHFQEFLSCVKEMVFYSPWFHGSITAQQAAIRLVPYGILSMS